MIRDRVEKFRSESGEFDHSTRFAPKPGGISLTRRSAEFLRKRGKGDYRDGRQYPSDRFIEPTTTTLVLCTMHRFSLRKRERKGRDAHRARNANET